jgi:hypothetical protein
MNICLSTPNEAFEEIRANLDIVGNLSKCKASISSPTFLTVHSPKLCALLGNVVALTSLKSNRAGLRDMEADEIGRIRRCTIAVDLADMTRLMLL